MKQSFLLRLVLALACSAPVVQADEPAPPPTPTDKPLFTRHVIPLMSRLGCNAGTCHGAVQGKNGFRLSLFGVDPEQDHQHLLREAGGRRLNFFSPRQSLLLLKATGQVAHGGGKRMSPGQFEYDLLLRWVQQGARLDDVKRSQVKELRISPERKTLPTGQSYDLRVQASFADGSSQDVTSLCTFQVPNEDVVSVSPQGKVQARGVGDTAIVVRYGAEPVLAMVVVPRSDETAFPQVKAHNFIDEHVLNKLQRLNIHPTKVCDDVTFLRRASLDVTGALPHPKEIRAFLADKDPNKRARKIDELLNRPGYAALWATRFSDLLKASGWNANYAFVEAAESRRMYDWLRGKFKENLPYDQLVERILTATSREGRSQEDWLQEVQALVEENVKESADLNLYNKRRTLDLYWQRQEATGIKGTLQIAHAFLGLRLECAQCHRHPHDVWKQDDLLSFANFFMRVKGASYPNKKTLPAKAAEMLKTSKTEAKKLNDQAKKLDARARNKKLSREEMDKLRAEVNMLRMKAKAIQNGPRRFGTEIYHQTTRPRFASVSSPLGRQSSNQFRLLGESKPIDVPRDKDPRHIVMAWMRRPDNPYFARAIANRVWAHYLGRGLVDPADHLSPLNPASHPELLRALARGFIKNRYDLKWLHRTILNSRTYQQSARPHSSATSDRRNYAAFYLRRLPAEVMVDAINHATAGKETYPAKLYLPANARALEVAGVTRVQRDSASLAFALQIFGRPLRNPQVQCDCERDATTTIVQTLYLANHPQVRAKIASDTGRVAQILKQHSEPEKQIEEVFLWSVSRLPTPQELQSCVKHIKQSSTPKKGLEDVLWSLLGTREFILNH